MTTLLRGPMSFRATPILAMLAAILVVHTSSFSETNWTDANDLLVEGRAFEERKAPWDRLPARAEDLVRPPVWGNSRHSAGIAIRFLSDSPSIEVRWKLTGDRLEMKHMPATGVSGVDLYVRTNLPGNSGWRWVGNGRPSAVENQKRLASGLEPVTREWMLYLPLYNGVESIEIGTAEGAFVGPAENAITSDRLLRHIDHAWRLRFPPGHDACGGFSARRLDVPIVNLGFSGSGTLRHGDRRSDVGDRRIGVRHRLPSQSGRKPGRGGEPFHSSAAFDHCDPACRSFSSRTGPMRMRCSMRARRIETERVERR